MEPAVHVRRVPAEVGGAVKGTKAEDIAVLQDDLEMACNCLFEADLPQNDVPSVHATFSRMMRNGEMFMVTVQRHAALGQEEKGA